MKITRYSKAQAENCKWFQSEVARRLVEIGAATDNVPLCYRFCLETVLGKLLITPLDDGWVACRWLDVPAAREAFAKDARLNQISGKWNFVFDDAMFKTRRDTERAVEDFFCGIEMYLTTQVK